MCLQGAQAGEMRKQGGELLEGVDGEVVEECVEDGEVGAHGSKGVQEARSCPTPK